MEQRVIKKYANRKLYDITGHQYTTLKSVVGMVRDGQNVVVIRNNDKADITRDVLVSALSEELVNNKDKISVDQVKKLINYGV